MNYAYDDSEHYCVPLVLGGPGVQPDITRICNKYHMNT